MTRTWKSTASTFTVSYVGWGPKELAPAADVVAYCREVGKETGAIVEYGEDKELLKGADALYTDIWASMGEEDKIPERVKLLTPYKVTGEVLKEGDIVSVDVGAYIGGFHGDCAATYPCGKISEEAQRLIDVTRQSFFEGFAQAREGNRISDISHAVQAYVEANGFSVVREYVGHGVGRNMHEAPEIPNYGAPGHGPKLLRGMTIAVEPMVNAGTAAIRQMSDGWTVKTRDGKYAAHYENTILITAGEPEILTAPAP